MSRPYVVVLFLFGSAILSSLVYLHFHLMERQHAELIAITLDVQERSVEALGEDVRFFTGEMRGLLEDDAKMKFRPLLRISESVNQEIEAHIEAISVPGNGMSIDDWRTSIGERLREITSIKKEVFMSHHLDFDMTVRDMEESFLGHNELIEGDEISFTSDYELSDDPAEYRWARGLLTEQFFMDCRQILVGISRVGCLRSTSIDVDFPVVISPFNLVQSGEMVELELGIGSFTPPRNPEDVEYLVNGTKVEVGYNGIANYSFVPKGKGEQKMELELSIKVPLTGEVRKSKNTYTYWVR
jgi:hypothetical protein